MNLYSRFGQSLKLNVLIFVDPAITTPPPAQKSSLCTKPGYEEVNGQCYKLNTERQRYNESEAACRADGGAYNI